MLLNIVQIKELFVVMMATAVAVVVIFVTAVANAGEFRAASRAYNMAGIDIFAEADRIAASGAFNFDEIITVAAITVIIVAIAAAAVVFIDLIVIFFESAEIFVDLFDVRFEIFGVFLETGDRICDITENVENCGNYFIVAVETFCKTFDVSNFFGNVHDFEPLYHTEV